MTAKMNVPALRFPEFEGEWKKYLLKDISLKITDGTHDTPKQVEKGIPFLTAIHIKDGWIDYDNCYYLTQDVHDKIYKRCDPKVGDVLMVNIGAGTATCAIVNVEYEFSLKNVALIRPNQQFINPNFLEQIQRKNSKRIFNEISSGGAQPFLGLATIEKLKVNAPSLPEQQKIAAFLTAVDDKIQQLTRKKNLLEQYKKGVMQQLFSQQLRFRDDAGNDFPDWEEKTLGEIASFFSGGTPASSNSTFYNGNIPFIKSGEISFSKTEQFLTEEGLKNSSAKLVSKGDILYALYGATSGQVAISKINGAINQAVLCIRSSESHEYITFFLSFNKAIITSRFLQGGQGNLSADIVKSISIPLPSRLEQQKIASFLSAIDEKINHVTTQLQHTQQWKKGLLQQMFV